VSAEEYRAYLRSDYWWRTRKRIYQRDRYECRICGAREGLQVHHKFTSYERLGAELDTDLITVCDRCHKRIHGKR
jgi:5-methylcytosine-specific restriction endonuclease McrA